MFSISALLIIVSDLQNLLCSLSIRTPTKYLRATLKRAQTAFYEPDARFAMPVHPPSIHSQLLSHFLTPFKQKRTPNRRLNSVRSVSVGSSVGTNSYLVIKRK